MSFLLTAAMLLNIQSLKLLSTISFQERHLHLYTSEKLAEEGIVTVCSTGFRYYIFSTNTMVDCKMLAAHDESIEYCNDPWFSPLLQSPGVVFDIRSSMVDIVGCNMASSARKSPNTNVSVFNIIKNQSDDYYLSYGNVLVSQFTGLHIPSVVESLFSFQTKPTFEKPQKKTSGATQMKMLSLSTRIFLYPVNHFMNYDKVNMFAKPLCIQLKHLLAPIKYSGPQSSSSFYSSIFFSHPFMITSENPTLYQPWNLKDLFFQCGYEPPHAHLRPVVSSSDIRSVNLSVVDSKCNVLHIEVGSSQRGRRRQLQSSSFSCIEDFLDSVPIAAYSSNISANIHMHENITYADGESPLHFITTLGHNPSRDVDDVDYNVKLSFYELIAVIKAFMNSKYNTIKVESLASIFDHRKVVSKHQSATDTNTPKRIDKQMKQLFVDMILIFTADKDRERVASRILSDLHAVVMLTLVWVRDETSYEKHVSIAIANERYYHDIVEALVKSFHAYIMNPGVFNICEQGDTEELPEMARSQLYLCDKADFRNQLARTLRKIPAIDDTHSQYLQTLIEYLPILPQVSPSLKLSRNDLVAVSVSQNGEAHMPTYDTISRSEDELASSVVNISIDGDAYLLLFVHPRHVSLAQFLVNHWQKNCDCHICFMFLKYLIIPIHSEGYSDSAHYSDHNYDDDDDDDVSMRQTERSFILLRPPLRLVLSYVRQFIKDVTTKKDLVVILVGLEAIFSFRQPGLEDVDSCGLIPSLRYGQLLKYNLPNRIITAASLDRSGHNFYAIAGICSDIYDLIRFVVRNSRSVSNHYQDNDELELRQLLTYAELNFDVVNYDIFSHIFVMETLTYLLDDAVDRPHDNCDNRLYRYSGEVMAIISKLVEENTNYNSNKDDFNSRAVSDSLLFSMDYCEFFMISCENSNVKSRLPLPTRDALGSKIEQLGFPSIRNMEYMKGYCQQINFKSMEDGFYFLGDSLITKGLWGDAFLYIHYIIQESIHCSDFNRLRDIIYHQLIQCAKASLHNIVSIKFPSANKQVSTYEFQSLAMLNTAYLQHYRALVQDELRAMGYLPYGLEESVELRMHDLERAVDAMECDNSIRCEYIKSLHAILLPLHIAISSLRQESASYPDLLNSMHASLGEESFVDVDRKRKQWLRQRRYLNKMIEVAQSTTSSSHPPVVPTSAEVRIEDIVRLHVVTYSSEDNDDLQSLLISALLAGIEIEVLTSTLLNDFILSLYLMQYLYVLGLDSNYLDYSAKLLAYCNYLLDNPDLDEEDYVLFIDAFDVLVFPRLQHDIYQYMAQSTYPIVFCVENSIYPEFATSFLYPRHSGIPSTVNGAKFLNSGCMLGRVGQMKKMFRYAKKYALSIRDDQQIFVRYLLQHSDEVGLDTTSTLFLTTHKQSSSMAAFQLQPDLDFTFRNRSVGLVHFNNKKSNGLYAYFSLLVRQAHQMFFEGEDGQHLLMSIHHLASGRRSQAEEILSWSSVKRNRTSNGGSNSIGDYLMQKHFAA